MLIHRNENALLILHMLLMDDFLNIKLMIKLCVNLALVYFYVFFLFLSYLVFCL